MKMIRDLVVLAFVCCSIGGAQTPLRELLDAKYRGHKELSKLTFAFNEAGRFFQKKIGANQIRLTFPNTTSAKYANRVPVIFKSGHAKSLSFDFSRDDTMAVLITMNDDVACDIRKPQGKATVVLDMYSKEEAAVNDQSVDLAAIVKNQIEDANEAAKKKESPVRSQSFFDIQFIPFVASLLISLLGTAGMMYWIVKPAPPTRTAPARAMLPERTAQTTTGVDAILDQARIILQEKAARTKPNVIAPSDEDAVTTLARTFGRGQGELQFARTMETRNREYMWEKKLQGMDTQRRDPITRAKKLGVGRGELALAASLRKIHDEQLRKEPLT
jgi:hypothetical protein